MTGLWKPGGFERGGNTKTQGICRGEFIVHDNLPEHMRRGIYAKPQTFKAWVRFSGPGPYITPDIDDVGFMSISIKLMGVEGPKLLDDELHTLDMFGVSTATFVTPDAKANAALQHWSVKNAQLFYFLNLRAPHVFDMIMQALYTKTQSSPFEAPYFSCVPYLMGEGQAMSYSVWPTSSKKTRIPRLPLRPPDDYLRDAMVASLAEGDVELEVRVQMQTDPHLMPIENAGVLWPTSAVAARARRHAPPAEADLRLARADGVREAAVLQPVAHDRRAPSAGQPEPGAEADVLGAVAAAAPDERGAALRADGRRAVRRGRRPDGHERPALGLRAAQPAARTPDRPRSTDLAIRLAQVEAAGGDAAALDAADEVPREGAGGARAGRGRRRLALRLPRRGVARADAGATSASSRRPPTCSPRSTHPGGSPCGGPPRSATISRSRSTRSSRTSGGARSSAPPCDCGTSSTRTSTAGSRSCAGTRRSCC